MRDLLDKLNMLEGFMPEHMEGEVEFEFTGDDGETQMGTLHYKAEIKQSDEHGYYAEIDPKSLEGECEPDGNAKVDDELATMVVQPGALDHEAAMDAAFDDAMDEIKNADNKYSHGESINDSDTQTEDEIKPGQGALDKFRELYRKGIGSDDDEFVLRELIKQINDDALFADEFTQLRQFTDPGPHGHDEVLYAKNVPGDTADEKIESLIKTIGDDGWVESFAKYLMYDLKMDENTELGDIKQLSGLDTNEEDEQTFEGEEFYEYYGYLPWHEDVPVDEAEYRGRKVKLGKPMRGDVKKFKVFVRDPKTKNIKKVNFGDPNMRIKKSNPKRRKSFRARHNCDNPGPRTKARYWSCRKW